MWLMAFDKDVRIEAPTVDFARAWGRARDRAGISQDALAAFMGIRTSQLADQLAGRGHLSMQRVFLIAKDSDGVRFLRFLFTEIAQQLGVDLDALFRISQLDRLIGRYESRALKSAGTSKERIS